MLTLGWSDGSTFMPIDFSLLSSKTHKLNGISDKINKRSSAYQRRLEALQSAPEQIPNMIKLAMDTGIEASYVLMDTWFTFQPLIKTIKEQGLDVIGMVKQLKQRYIVGNKRVSLNEIYKLAQPVSSQKRELLRSILTTKPMVFKSKLFLFAIVIKRVNGLRF